MLRPDDVSQPDTVVDQMRHRAAIVAAACPGVPIDTDDWRRYLSEREGLGVPALYYATHLDRTGEALRTEDCAAVRDLWARWSERS